MYKKKTRKRLSFLLTLALLIPLCQGVMPERVAEAATVLNNPTTNSNGVTSWDCVWFGNYWQEDTNGDGKADKNDAKTPIKWRVLSVDGDDAFLLADQNLDVQRYNDTDVGVTWETCTMRSWLNGYGADSNVCEKDYTSDNFLDNAFSTSEQAAIQNTVVVNEDNPYYNTEGGNDTTDKVYLLSIDEVLNSSYGFTSINGDTTTREASSTAYRTSVNSVGITVYWWLRSPGSNSCDASYVHMNGGVDLDGHYVHYCSEAVRPTLHLNLSSTSGWSYAGTVSSDESVGAPQETNTPSVITITYDANGGYEAPESQIGIYGESLTLSEERIIRGPLPYDITYDSNEPSDAIQQAVPDTPSVEVTSEYPSIFQNWNTSPDGNGITYYPGDVYDGMGNLTLYAQYDRTKVVNDLMSKIYLPTYSNYTFLGWYTQPVGGEKASTPMTLTEDVTLYAHWGAVEISTSIPSSAPSSVPPTATPGEFTRKLKNPRIDANGITTWDCIWFGNYWQEDTNGDGKADQNDDKTPIKWRVLSVDGDDAFLVADKNMDCQKYNDTYTDVTWENCTMRSWLNGYGAEANKDGKDYGSDNFLRNAFSETEQSAIKTTKVVNNDNSEYGTEGGKDTLDKVYLLSLEEVTSPAYGFSGSSYDLRRAAKTTEYAKSQGVWADDPLDVYIDDGCWWLRSPGENSDDASYVGVGGPIYDYNVCGNDFYGNEYAARPALHLNLSFISSWSYAGTVTVEGKVDETEGTPPTEPGNTQKPQETVEPVGTDKPSATPTAPGTSSVIPSVPQPSSPATPTLGISSDSGKVAIEKVSALKLKQKKSTVIASWKKLTGVKGYQICYSTSNKWKGKKQKLVTKNNVVIKNLKKKKTYYFRVRAYRLEGTKKVYGAWSSVKKIKR